MDVETRRNLHSKAIERFNERRRLEWQMALSFWGGIVLAGRELEGWFFAAAAVLLVLATLGHLVWADQYIARSAKRDRDDGIRHEALIRQGVDSFSELVEDEDLKKHGVKTAATVLPPFAYRVGVGGRNLTPARLWKWVSSFMRGLGGYEPTEDDAPELRYKVWVSHYWQVWITGLLCAGVLLIMATTESDGATRSPAACCPSATVSTDGWVMTASGPTPRPASQQARPTFIAVIETRPSTLTTAG